MAAACGRFLIFLFSVCLLSIRLYPPPLLLFAFLLLCSLDSLCLFSRRTSLTFPWVRNRQCETPPQSELRSNIESNWSRSRSNNCSLVFSYGESFGHPFAQVHSRFVKKMGLNHTHFDIIIQHLGATLKELKVDPTLVAEAAAIAESQRDEVLNL